jgi:hypothetical protein
MVELPEHVINHIKSFIPKDKDCKSPTVDVILPFVKLYNRIDTIQKYPFTPSHPFQEFMRDPYHYCFKLGRMCGEDSMICSRCEGIEPYWVSNFVVDGSREAYKEICEIDINFLRQAYKNILNKYIEF